MTQYAKNEFALRPFKALGRCHVIEERIGEVGVIFVGR